jgi:hypothetical protein
MYLCVRQANRRIFEKKDNCGKNVFWEWREVLEFNSRKEYNLLREKMSKM